MKQRNETIESTISTDYCDVKDFEDSIKRNEVLMIILVEDIEEALKDKPHVVVEEKLLGEYYNFLCVFSKDEADKLPPHRQSDHQIILKPGVEPP